MYMIAPLFIRSVYSLLSSMCSIEKTVLKCKEYGYKSCAIVDKNVLAGAMSFKKACEKEKIKPIYGIEFSTKIDEREYSMFMLAKNDEGYKNLMALSSYLCRDNHEYITIDELNNYRKDNFLCLFSDDMPLTYIVDKQMDIEEGLNKQEELFGKDYVVAFVDHDKAINTKRDNVLRPYLKKRNILTIALNRTYYLNHDDVNAYKILKCIRDKETITNNTQDLDDGRYLLNPNEYKEIYEEDDLNCTDAIASACNVYLDYKTSLPKYEHKDYPSKDYLVALCKEGLKRRLKNNVPIEYSKRLDYELSVILKMHFEDYFLVVYDFILYAKKNDIMVGPGRGSGAASLVAYCLGITDINPIQYGLIFERFLNPERISMPDIDSDFPDDRRDEVIDYIKEKYGKDHVAHIITYGTLKAKQVIRDVGRVLNYSVFEIDSINKLIPNGPHVTLMDTYNEYPIFKQKIESDERYRKLFSIALKLEGFPRHESTHAAGIVLSRKELSEVVPIIEVEQGIYSTQYTMEHLEELGLIKMDILGIRNLSITNEIVSDINKYETKLNIKEIPLNDKKTFDLIDKANTLGIFQLESSGMMNLIRKFKPQTFEEIGIVIALFRPGPMENIDQFIQNKNNPRSITYLHSALEPILKETYGIIVYQEQIMAIARKMAGFTFGKADLLRRAMSKKKAEQLESLADDFIEGCVKNGYTKELATSIYDLILKFANYGFNKSHSIVYARVAYEQAYLKTNYPKYFYKALLNGVIGAESKTFEYIKECLSINQKVKAPSINESINEYIILDDAIIMPFGVCKEVGIISSTKIIEERERNGLYKDYLDAVCRLTNIGIERKVIENLIYAGAFDCFKKSRNTMITALTNSLKYASAHKGINLLDIDDSPIIEELNDNLSVAAEYEKEVLGFYFSYNPISEIKKNNNINVKPLNIIGSARGYQKGFGLIKHIKNHKTKNGDPMAFVDIIDETGSLSLVVMPDAYQRYQLLLEKGKYLYFEGNNDKESSVLVKMLKGY